MQIKTESLAMLASLMSHQSGVDVQSQGNSAYSYRDENGRGHIVIPTLVDDSDMLDLVRGYVDHETAHLIYTDFNCIPSNDPVIKRIHNIYEDALVERRMSQRFPGCRANLSMLNELVLHRDAQGAAPVDAGSPEQIAAAVLNYILCRSSATAYPVMAGDADEVRDVLLSAGLTPDFLDGLDSIIDGVRAVSSTEDTRALAEKTTEYLRRHLGGDQGQNQQQQQQEGGTGSGRRQQDGKGSESSGKDSGGSRQNSGAQQDGDGSRQNSGSQQDGDGSRQDGDGSRRNSNQSGKKILDALVDADTGDVSSRAAEMINGNQEDRKLTRTSQQCVDVQESRKGAAELSDWARPDFTVVSQEAAAEAFMVTAQLRQRMASLLQDHVLNRTGGFRRGRIDGHRLARLAVNDSRIFMNRTDKIDVSADVLILADASGSMGSPSVMRIMTLGMYSVLTALRGIRGVRAAAHSFGGRCYSRLADYSTPAHEAKLCMQWAFGETFCGSALHLAVQYMQRNSRPNGCRKILLVMTDGVIDDEHVFRVDLDVAERLGIEVIGLGLCHDAVTGLLPAGRAEMIQHFSEFPQAIFTLLQNRLIRRG